MEKGDRAKVSNGGYEGWEKSQGLELTATRTRQHTARQDGSGCGAAAVQLLPPGPWKRGG